MPLPGTMSASSLQSAALARAAVAFDHAMSLLADAIRYVIEGRVSREEDLQLADGAVYRLTMFDQDFPKGFSFTSSMICMHSSMSNQSHW